MIKLKEIRDALKDIDFRDSLGMQAAIQLDDYDYCIKSALAQLFNNNKNVTKSHALNDATIKSAIQLLTLARILNDRESKEIARILYEP